MKWFPFVTLAARYSEVTTTNERVCVLYLGELSSHGFTLGGQCLDFSSLRLILGDHRLIVRDQRVELTLQLYEIGDRG